MDKRVSFKEELRKSLIIHVLMPCLLFIIVFLCSLLYLIFGVVSKDNRKNGSRAAEEFHGIIESYREHADLFAAATDYERFLYDRSYHAERMRDVYQFLNSNKVKADFYIVENTKEIIYPEGDRLFGVLREELGNCAAKIKSRGNAPVYIYAGRETDSEEMSAYMIASPLYRDGEICAAAVYLFDMKSMDLLLRSSTSDIVLVNRYNRVIFESRKKFADERGKLKSEYKLKQGLNKAEGKYYYISATDTETAGVRAFSFYDCTLYVTLCFIIMFISLLISASVITAVIISARKFSDSKSKMIYQLIEGLKRVEDGDLSVRLDFKSGDEFDDIGKGFNMMIGSISHLLQRHEDLARENIQAAVAVMESQFNPHFLFNTLESIKYMIAPEPKAASRMLIDLSRLLRYSIQNDRECVMLSEELDFAERYINIMLTRYKDRLGYKYCSGKTLEKLYVPRMILQPIIENSIKYGYGEDSRRLNISIDAELSGDKLILTIKDDGIGIEKKLLEELCSNLDKNYNSSGHIGIYNVNRRIALLYGSDYGLRLKNGEKGTVVRLILPVIKEGEKYA